MNPNGGPSIFRTKSQVVQQFMGGFFQWLAQNGIPNPHQELCQVILYVNLFADYREQIKEGLKRERENMTADIMVARRAFNLLQQAQNIPQDVLEKALADLGKQYAPKAPEPTPTPGDPNPVPQPTAEVQPEAETAPDNVVEFTGGEPIAADAEMKPAPGETTGPEGEPQEG